MKTCLVCWERLCLKEGFGSLFGIAGMGIVVAMMTITVVLETRPKGTCEWLLE